MRDNGLSVAWQARMPTYHAFFFSSGGVEREFQAARREKLDGIKRDTVKSSHG